MTIGLIPLLPYLASFVFDISNEVVFSSSLLMTAFCFLLVGYSKGKVTDTSKRRSMLETLALGLTAALIAFVCGDLLTRLL